MRSPLRFQLGTHFGAMVGNTQGVVEGSGQLGGQLRQLIGGIDGGRGALGGIGAEGSPVFPEGLQEAQHAEQVAIGHKLGSFAYR